MVCVELYLVSSAVLHCLQACAVLSVELYLVCLFSCVALSSGVFGLSVELYLVCLFSCVALSSGVCCTVC